MSGHDIIFFMKGLAQHKKIKVKDSGTKNAGIVTFTSYKLETPRAIEIDKILKNAKNMDPKEYQALVKELDTICTKKRLVKRNLCVLVGRSMMAGRLAGETTYTGIINYGCLGTSATAVSDSDTQLGAEVKRKAVGTRTRINDQVNFEFYFSKSDTSGTYQEFGMVVDGTLTANTGVQFNRLLTGGWTKSAAEALTVAVQININHA